MLVSKRTVAIDALREDGSGLSDQLRYEIDVLGLIPLHDCGHTLDLRGPDKVRGAQVSAFSLPLAACRRTLPTPARCQLLQECQCKTFGRHGRAFCKWITAIARCEVHRQCLSAQDVPHGRVGRQSSRRGSERRAFSRGCG